MGLYADALRSLGEFLGGPGKARRLCSPARRSDWRRRWRQGMPFFDDTGFWKRAQIAANDLVLAGVAEFDDLDELTIFADNLVPHVLRVDGVLVYDPPLADHIDRGELLPPGPRRPRSARARCMRACTSRASSACRSAGSTRGCGTAARSRATRRYRVIGPRTVY